MQLMLENSPEKQNAYAEHCTIFPDNRPYADLLRRDDHHPLCAYHHGQAPHSTHHRYGIGRSAHRQIRAQHPGARLFL